MKIVQIIPSLNTGGAERFVVDLCNEMSKNELNKIYLIIFFKTNEENFLKNELSNKIELIEFDKKLGFDINMLIKLFKILYKIKPNIVNTHTGSFEYLIVCFLLFFKRIKFYHTIHSDAKFESPNKYLRFLKKNIFKYNFSKPITISQTSSNSYREAYRLFNDYIILNGRNKIVSTKLFNSVKNEFISNYRITEKTNILINVASIQKVKNQINLIKAVDELINNNVDIVLLIIGSPRGIEDKLTKELYSYESERIIFLGQKNNVSDYLLLSDIFCLTSLKEGMPISLIEAFSSKKECICTPAGGINDMIVNNFNGFLTSDFDAKNIQKTIKKVIGLTKTEKNKISTNAYNSFVDNYSIQKSASEYIRFYENS